LGLTSNRAVRRSLKDSLPVAGGQAVRATALTVLLLTAYPPNRLSAQGSGVETLAVRLASMTAVTGLEQAMADSLLALVPGSARDRAGNVTLTLGGGNAGGPKRLVACPLDEVGYVVGNLTDDGYLTLRRVGTRAAYPLFDQQLEGQPVTVFGAGGPVPGVVAVKSTHLTRGRPAGSDPVFTADNAYVDVGATSRDEVRALGIALLAPVALTKRPHRYGDRLLAAPAAGRRAACAALVAAARAKPRVKGTVVVAFTVQSLYATNAGLSTVQALRGPFDETKQAALATRYTDTAVETVSLKDAEELERELVKWMEGR